MPQFLQDASETLTPDELHREVVHALVLADAEHGHDVGMVQSRRGPGFAPEALEVRWGRQPGCGQDLQRDVPAQGFLHSLIDDPHAAASHLAEDAVFAELSGRPVVGFQRSSERAWGQAPDGAEPLHLHEGGKEAVDTFGLIGVPFCVLTQRGPLAASVAPGELLGELD